MSDSASLDPIQSDPWQQVEPHLSRVLELPPAERGSYLDEQVGQDGELRHCIETYLAFENDMDGFLDPSTLTGAGALQGEVEAWLPPRRELAVGETLGPYRVERVLGQGGMSTVYLAQDMTSPERRVALKVIQPGPHRSEVARRLLAEQHILARLDHPGIAKLFSGGTTDEGLPYFVMEAIDGQPIDVYCDRRRLSLGDRLRLFRQVCDAVHYAHQNLVVHRDIKPSNILVTAEGVPKLLDFGIAKVLDATSGPEGDSTVTGLRPMTPNYASPEQIRGEPITTASDVFSLGVLLYKLTTGRLPFRFPGRLPQDGDAAWHQRRPLEPSAVVRGMPLLDITELDPQTIAQRLGTTPERLSRTLRGDLDNIVLMALRGEALRRYSSAESLAEDLQRWHAGLPVRARPDTAFYRARKFLGRNKAWVTAAAAIMLLVVSYAVLTARHSSRLQTEQRQTAEVAEFLISLYGSPTLGLEGGESITARELLEQGAVRVQEGPGLQPGVKATLQHSLGRGFSNLRLFDRALPLFEEALEARRRDLGKDHPQTLETLHFLAVAHRGVGDYRRSIEVFEEALTLGRRHGGDALPLARTLIGLAALRRDQGDFAAAEEAGRRALDLLRQDFGEDHAWTTQSKSVLAGVLFEAGAYDEAEALYQDVVPLMRRLGEPAPLAQSLNGLAMLRVQRGDASSAEPLALEALALYGGQFGETHPTYAHSLMILSFIYQEAGDLEMAEDHSRKSLALLREHYGGAHPHIARVEYNLALILSERGAYAEAERLLRQALVVARQMVGPHDVRTANCQVDLAHALHAQGRLDEAETQFRQGLASLQKAPLGTSHIFLAHARLGLGALLVDDGRWQEAEPLLQASLEALRESFGDSHWRVAQARSELGACYLAAGRVIEAEPLLVHTFQKLAAHRGEGSEISRRAAGHLEAYTRATMVADNIPP